MRVFASRAAPRSAQLDQTIARIRRDLVIGPMSGRTPVILKMEKAVEYESVLIGFHRSNSQTPTIRLGPQASP